MSRDFCSVVEGTCLAPAAFATGLGTWDAPASSKVRTKCHRCGAHVCTECSRIVEHRRICLNCEPKLAPLYTPRGDTMPKKKKSAIAAATAAYYDDVRKAVKTRELLGRRGAVEQVEAVIAKSGVSFDIGLISRIRLDGGTVEQRKFIVERLSSLWNAGRKA